MVTETARYLAVEHWLDRRILVDYLGESPALVAGSGLSVSPDQRTTRLPKERKGVIDYPIARESRTVARAHKLGAVPQTYNKHDDT